MKIVNKVHKLKNKKINLKQIKSVYTQMSNECVNVHMCTLVPRQT